MAELQHQLCFDLFFKNTSILQQAIPAYAVTKTALLGLVKGLVGSLAPKNIRVNGIAPGLIDTKFSAAVSIYSVLKFISTSIKLERKYKGVNQH